MLFTCGAILEWAGYECETLSDSCRVGEVLECFAPHVVVTDLEMPGKDGLAVVDDVHCRQPETPVVLMTGSMDPGVDAAAALAGVAEVLRKPFPGRQLKDCLRRVLRQRQVSRGPS